MWRRVPRLPTQLQALRVNLGLYSFQDISLHEALALRPALVQVPDGAETAAHADLPSAARRAFHRRQKRLRAARISGAEDTTTLR